MKKGKRGIKHLIRRGLEICGFSSWSTTDQAVFQESENFDSININAINCDKCKEVAIEHNQKSRSLIATRKR